MNTGGRPQSLCLLPHFGPLPDETWRQKEASQQTRAEIGRRTAIMHDIHLDYIELLGREVAKYGWAPRRPRSDAPIKTHKVGMQWSNYRMLDMWDRLALEVYQPEEDDSWGDDT